MNIYDLISRAQKLRKETQLDSVSPDRVGGLHEDTLKYINEFQLLASSPSLHKIYASVSAMQSDKSPKSDLTGKPLKPGQLVVIVPANQTDATAGDVYRYDGPSGNTSAWTFVAKIGAVPADAELSATSTNPPQNKVVTEKLTELESKVFNEVFNLDKEDWSIEKTYVVNAGDTHIVLPYLGKTASTFYISGTGPQKFRIQATNKATGNAINIIDVASAGTELPLEVVNPRPDLELIDVNVFFPSTATIGDTLTVKIVKRNLFATENERQDNELDGLRTYVESLKLVANSATSAKYKFEKNSTYKITSLSQSAQYVTLTTRETAEGERVDAIDSIMQGQTITFIPTNNASYLRVGDAITIEVIKADSLADANNKIVGIEGNVSDIQVNTTAFEFETPSATVIQYPFRIGETYKITSISQSVQYVTLTTRETADGTTIDKIGAFTNGMTQRFTPTTNANYLRISNAISIKITKESSLIWAVETLAENVDDLSNGIDNEMFNLDKEDWTFDKSFNVHPGYASYFLPYLGKTPCKFIVDGLDSASFVIQGTNKKTGSVINILPYADGINLPIEIANPRPDLELINLRLYVPADSTTEGVLNVKLVKDSPLKKILNPNWTEEEHGCYPFGNGIDYEPAILDIPGIMDNFTSLEPWYDLYDALMSQYPNYISKEDCDATFLADNPSVVRPDALSDMPIYLYKFSPSYPYKDNYGRPTQKQKLKVFVVTGTHPEYISMWSCYQGMKAICEQWRTDANLKALRWNVEFYIMPCSGPWGITHATRTNYNGVDLNRNMASRNWVLSGEYGDNTYSGPSAGSEYESKLLAYYIDRIDPLIFVDYHNFGANKSGNIMFGSSERQLGIDIMTTIYPEVCAEMTNQYTDLPDADSEDFQLLLGYFGTSSSTGARSQYACDRDNCIGVTHETFYSFYWDDGRLDLNSNGHIRDGLVCSIATNTWLRVLLRLIKNVADRWTAIVA